MKSFIKRMNQGLLYSNFLWFKIFHPVGKFVKTQDVLKGVKRLYPVEKLIKPGGGGNNSKGSGSSVKLIKFSQHLHAQISIHSKDF